MNLSQNWLCFFSTFYRFRTSTTHFPSMTDAFSPWYMYDFYSLNAIKIQFPNNIHQIIFLKSVEIFDSSIYSIRKKYQIKFWFEMKKSTPKKAKKLPKRSIIRQKLTPKYTVKPVIVCLSGRFCLSKKPQNLISQDVVDRIQVNIQIFTS